MKYDFKKIEKKWQKVWAKKRYKIWRADDRRTPNTKRKAYVLDMFPYPSGEGLHVGHAEGYTASDIVARYLRMKGRNVLHPMGWDAFGLPAENYAIKKKIHPGLVVKNNVKRFKKQLEGLGFSYDWQKEINTTDPEYYKWTQWIFLQLFKRGLAYEAMLPVNWCPSCKTVLANEEVIDGRCDRCESLAERRNLKQWVLKITAYADRLFEDLKELDWPARVKEMQKNWIGRSEGRIIRFSLTYADNNAQTAQTGADHADSFPRSPLRSAESVLVVEVFTTRPDTIDGVTYLVLAPEHPIIPVLKNKIKNWKEVGAYIAVAENKSERDRVAEAREKTGVELKGIQAINPYNGEKIPVWISDYVIISYGTGAIMAVPQHDERDRQFAEKFDLPIKDAPLVPEKKWPGEKKVNYKLRDWIFSRQRYWGEPIPLIFCESCKKSMKNPKSQILNPKQILTLRVMTRRVKNSNFQNSKHESSIGELLNPGWIAVPEDDLPVELPKVKNYQPTGKAESPLAAIKKWVKVKCPNCGGPAKRETNTMPQWAGSNWYYIAYVVRKNSKFQIPNSKKIDYWLPVDIYVGGVEHAVLHLLYVRFWHKFLYDIGAVSTKEPFRKLVNQGLILGPDNQKMSKSRGNVVNPDEMTDKFGADSLRLYEMFMGPLEDSKPWNPRGVVGMYRFLSRVYNLIFKSKILNPKQILTPRAMTRGVKNSNFQDTKLERLLHKTIKKVTEDIENFRFNTAISALMILLNETEKTGRWSLVAGRLFLKLLFPFAPHLAQELWQKLGHKTLLDYEPWPQWSKKFAEEEQFDLVVQISGRTRSVIRADKGISEIKAKTMALNDEKIQKWIGGKPIKKVIFVKDRLINLLV
jgi:leucyl-tRNA synthetase